MNEKDEKNEEDGSAYDFSESGTDAAIEGESETDGSVMSSPAMESGIGRGEDKSEKCLKEREEYLNGWKRAKADLINYKKEEGRRMESLVKFANEIILTDLILIMDSFDLAIAAEPQNKGLVLIRAQMEGFLKKQGLTPIETIGKKFNPAIHEAVGEVKTETGESEIVVEEIEKGWKLYDKIARVAKVKISK